MQRPALARSTSGSDVHQPNWRPATRCTSEPLPLAPTSHRRRPHVGAGVPYSHQATRSNRCSRQGAARLGMPAAVRRLGRRAWRRRIHRVSAVGQLLAGCKGRDLGLAPPARVRTPGTGSHPCVPGCEPWDGVLGRDSRSCDMRAGGGTSPGAQHHLPGVRAGLARGGAHDRPCDVPGNPAAPHLHLKVRPVRISAGNGSSVLAVGGNRCPQG